MGRLIPLLILATIACGCTSKSPPLAQVAQALVIEARVHDGQWRLFIEDRDTPADTKALQEAAIAHAERVDAAAGFAGRDERGQSVNRVILRAAPGAQAYFFVDVAEALQIAKVTRLELELMREGQPPLHCTVELPRDESLVEPSRVWLRLAYQVSDKDLNLVIDNIARLRIEAATLPVDIAKADWGDSAYDWRRNAIQSQLRALDPDHDGRSLTLSWDATTFELPYGAVFQVMDAVHRCNLERTKTGTSRLQVWLSSS